MDTELIRLLLVEDNPIDVEVIRGCLSDTPGVQIELEHADCFATAQERLANRDFDAALLDLNLADSSGLATVIRAHTNYPALPIVVLTGEESDQMAVESLKEGAEDYLCKSKLEPRLLLRTIRYAIERAGHRQADRQFRDEKARYRDLLAAVTTYNYSVTFANGSPAMTWHSLGCLSATGYSPSEYVDDPDLWIEMVHPEDRDSVLQHIRKIHAGEKVPPVEHRILHKDGTTRWIRDTVIHRYNETGDLVGYDGVVEDISRRKQAEETLREREAHLLAAQGIQARLWPKESPSLPGYDIAGAVFPAAFAAGDYFDYVPMLDGSLGLVIGDVSGHGLGPAIVMALTYAHLRSLLEIYSDVGDILARVNRFLINETDHFVTLLFGRLMLAARQFVGTNAGHPPGYVLNSKGHVKGKIGSTAVPLAVIPDATFPAGNVVALEPGDVVVLLTDGILETRSPDNAIFGMCRTFDVIRANQSRSAREIIEAIYDAVLNFCHPQKPDDDMTAIVIKVLADEDRSE